jgi:Hypoxia induced protein conserved region
MNLVNYVVPIALGTVFIVLLLGLWNMMRGGPSNKSQMFMRWRVGLQFVAIILMMTALYFSRR